MAGIKDDNLKILFCKGEYFRINPPKNKLINRLVYPVPHQNMEGIGIHVTVDMGGGVKLGPDVKYLESNIYDYKLTASKQEAFFTSPRKSSFRFLSLMILPRKWQEYVQKSRNLESRYGIFISWKKQAEAIPDLLILLEWNHPGSPLQLP